MKNILLSALAAALVWSAQPARAAGFLSVSEDVPLMTGFVEDAAAALVFDSPDGRIVEAAAQGAAAAAAVRAFYAETLPQLGWRADADADGRYVRDSEMLIIEIAEAGGRRLVRFRFVPVRN